MANFLGDLDDDARAEFAMRRMRMPGAAAAGARVGAAVRGGLNQVKKVGKVGSNIYNSASPRQKLAYGVAGAAGVGLLAKKLLTRKPKRQRFRRPRF